MFVHNQVWLYGHIERLKRMRDHILENPQANTSSLEVHLRALDRRDLLPDCDALEHGCTLGRYMIPDALRPNSNALVQILMPLSQTPMLLSCILTLPCLSFCLCFSVCKVMYIISFPSKDFLPCICRYPRGHLLALCRPLIINKIVFYHSVLFPLFFLQSASGT